MPLPKKCPSDAQASAEGASRKFSVPPPFRPLLRPWFSGQYSILNYQAKLEATLYIIKDTVQLNRKSAPL